MTELIIWGQVIAFILFVILVLNVIRLGLAIRQTRNVDQANRRLLAQGIRWNQMCEDVTEWVMGMEKEKKEEKKEEGKSAFCSWPGPCRTHEAMLPCPWYCDYYTNADFNMRKQFYEDSIKNAESGSEPYDPHN